tara:strand:- start:144 stop:545 length:402 start_codon:yes stop_codon:yes gene_type:complete
MDLRERKNINQQKTREFLQDTIDDLRNSIARTETLLREDKERLSFLLKDLQNRQPIRAKVFLDFKCDQFVSVETTLTPEEAESMTEDGMDALRVKYQSEAIKLYEERMSEGDFVWELDFHLQEADGSETEIKI